MLLDEDSAPVTLSEIYNQAHACRQAIYLADARHQSFEHLLPIDQYSDIIITGCGSSHHLAQCSSFAWSEMLDRPVQAVAASELMHFADHYLGSRARPLVIAISRSGGTTEVRLAVERLRMDYNARAVAITGERGGAVAEACDIEMAFDECYERSVVMTQAFTCMLTGLYLLADSASGSRRREEIKLIPGVINSSLLSTEQIVRSIAEDERAKRFFFLGSGAMKGLADECALKMTEMATDQAASHRAMEFRHGPKAVLSDGDQVMVFPTTAERPYLETLLEEITATGAAAIVVGNGFETVSAESTGIAIPQSFGSLSEVFLPAAYAHAGQLLAYWRATARGANPDAPPHLARTVLLNV